MKENGCEGNEQGECVPIEKIPRYSMKKDGVSFVFREKIEKEYNPDFEQEMETTVIDIVAEHKSKKYGFVARNIPDFGLAINPKAETATASGLKCGLPIDVTSFMQQNKSLAYSTERELTRQEQEEVFLKEHPTKTGLGWDRSFCKGKKWVAMTEAEAYVYKTLLKTLPEYMHEVRTRPPEH